MDTIRYIYRYFRNSILRILALICGRKHKLSTNVIIVAPHPDDEALGCGGLISHLTKSGCTISLIMLTGGENCTSAKSIEKETLKVTRRDLTNKSAIILGIKEENIYFLNFIDGNVCSKDPEITRLKDILNRINADAIYVPHLMDGWNDHVQAHLIIKHIIKDTSTKLYAYCVWFWYTMPFKDTIKLPWKNVRYFSMNKEEHKAKVQSVNIYMKAISPDGIYYSGELPKILLTSCLWKQEIYFRIYN
ncbi:N-acetylglucosaminyl deacetylase, LmbE family [Bacteroides luti]|uniref:N-acetylglucosaminyl deacetylase, LmbE family n=1 Tax=Bacteroides luti TaxID=1297750 RepID=A0A1M5BFZ6_9BACE|nr:PIG-L family deacetylase [Bacteroides luti]SHF41474.1 N-acetylglucosaminyl deacetylase, LmbE family [Bacteroides luti]